MQKNYSKSNLLTLIFSLFLFVSFYSCEKPGKLDGTIWECDPFETQIDNSYWQIEISFGKQEATTIKMSDMLLNTSYFIYHVPYQLKGKKLTIKIGSYGQGNWIGTVNKKSMTLDGVFGKTVEFRKK